MKRPFLVALAILVLTTACGGPVNVKQNAVVSLQSVETALGAAQDFERANHTALGLDGVASDAHRALCPAAALPVPLPAGATNHQVISCLLAAAFASQASSATALMNWQTGSPSPSVLTELKGELDALFGLVKGLAPTTNQQQLVTTIQNAVDGVLGIVAITGGL